MTLEHYYHRDVQSTHQLFHAAERAPTSIRPGIRQLVTEFESLQHTYEFCKGNDFLRQWILMSVEPAVSSKVRTINVEHITVTTSAEVNAFARISAITNEILSTTVARQKTQTTPELFKPQFAG